MKKCVLFLSVILSSFIGFSQIGVGTTTPHSTLDIRGSLSTNYRSFTTTTTATINDHVLTFTGTGATTITIPSAAGIAGRSYLVKNASTSGPTPALTIATTSSQTIDGITSWVLDEANESVLLVSNGSNWDIGSQTLPTGSGTNWSQGGNSVASLRTLGTLSNYDLPFITNNTEKMRLTSTGRLGIGTSTFNGTNPEKLLVDAGTTTSFNVISGKGSINNYLQLNIQNTSTGTAASSDLVATADNGSETLNFVDLGINSSTYSSSGILGGANTGYLYTTGSDFVVGNATAAKNLMFFTGGTATTNERMRITGTGNVGIGTSTFNATFPEKFVVDAGVTTSVNAIVGKGSIDSYLQLNIQNQSTGSSASSDVVATANNGSETTNFVDMGINGGSYSGGVMGGANDSYVYNVGQNLLIGTGTASKSLVFMTGGTSQSSNERMRIDGSGNVGIGIANPTYKLQVIAASNPLFLANVQTGSSTDSLLTIVNGVVRKLHPSSSSAWALTGNASTNSNNNFIGTTDAQALVIKVNNAQVGKFEANSLALGLSATTANSPNSYAFGSSAAIGYNKNNAFAIGNSAAVNSDNSFAIGNNSVANGSNSFAIGNGSAANNANSLAIGPNATTAYSISDAIAIGDNASVTSSNGIAIGSNSISANKTEATAQSSMAIGVDATSHSTNAIVIGTSATTGYNLTNPIAIGKSALANGDNAVVIGNSATIGYTSNSTALGAATSVSGNNSTAVGYNTAVTQNNALVLGDLTNANLAVGIGSESFSGSAREKLLVDAGTSASSYNVISGKGTINNYLQLNIQNRSNGASASSDIVATADNGNETNNFVNLGINSSGYGSSGVLAGANNAYLYTTGNDFIIGNSTNNKSLIFYTTASSNSTERMRITSAGLIPGQDNTYSAGNTTNRWTAVWAVNGTIQTSDERLKKNIHPLAYGLNEVMQLKPVSYDWKDNSGTAKIGLLAQEVKKIIPQVVVGNEEKENLGMNYAELVPVLINAVKEQQQQIKLQQEQIAELYKELKKVKEKK